MSLTCLLSVKGRRDGGRWRWSCGDGEPPRVTDVDPSGLLQRQRVGQVGVRSPPILNPVEASGKASHRSKSAAKEHPSFGRSVVVYRRRSNRCYLADTLVERPWLPNRRDRQPDRPRPTDGSA